MNAPRFGICTHLNPPAVVVCQLVRHPDMEMMTKLRSLRCALGMSLDELARRTGIERSRLSRAERSYLALREAELSVLGRELGGAPADLLKRVTSPDPETPR